VHPSTAHAGVIVDELVRCGVTDVVCCPGSRNAPLAFALHAADAAGRLRLHVRIDERGAGFLALGLAARSGRPVAVCTTSGTAAANLHPAVLEASHSGVPLLALTADRPPALVGTGANQTVVQAGIFGSAVRLAISEACAGDPVVDNGRWRARVCRAVAAALADPPGPVHLNLPFAEPLVPSGSVAAPAGRDGGRSWTTVAPVRRAAAALPLDPGAPTLVVAGQGASGEAAGWGLPVLAEPMAPPWSGALRTGPWLVATPAVTDAAGPLRPRQVIVTGRPTLHRAVQRLLADPDVEVYAHAGPTPWADVAGTVRAVGAVPRMAQPPGWGQAWCAADRAAGAALDSALDTPAAPAGLRLARALVAELPAGALLTLGSSNPVRDVSLAAAPRPGLAVLANRGVAGIDGTVSTAVGAALAHAGPGYALLGDLTLLHDATGLVIGAHEPRPDLTLVVLNDDGGGIFALLEQGAPEHAASFERVFATPHGVGLAALCAAVGVAHTACADIAELAGLLAPAPGLRVVEVPAERTGLRAGHAALRAALCAAVADALG